MHATLSGDRARRPGAERSSESASFGVPRGMPRFLRAASARERPDAARDAAPHVAIPFPHASAIESATGAAVPGSAVHDPEACRRQGVPAFTDGAVTHFAAPAPALTVAAHEAAHQLQHAGYTHDAGMGAERHAQSVARLIAGGASPRGLLGARGRSVAPALRPYTEVPAATQAASSEWVIGSDARVADTGQIVTSVTDRHMAYADPALIDAADRILEAKQSGVRLRPGAAGPSGAAPDGSGVKSTVQVVTQVRIATPSGDVWADCGRMSREVQGVTGTDTAPRGFYRDSGGVERETSPGGTTRIRDEALVGAGLGPDAGSARAAYRAMDPAAREAFDQAHGINRHAAPNVGESFMSVRDDALTHAGFNFHWGGVIMVSGGDRVTFENFYRPGTTYDTRNLLWYFDMYGPPSKAGQTWHDRWAEGPGREGAGVGAPGMGSMTIPTRTSADSSTYPATRTGELIRRRAAAHLETERAALDAELATRWITVRVEVVSAQEGPDDVYAWAGHGGRSRQTGAIEMGSGDRNTFWLPLRALVPVTGAIQIRVYEADVFSDDRISILSLEDAPNSDNRPWDDAEYHVTAEFEP